MLNVQDSIVVKNVGFGAYLLEFESGLYHLLAGYLWESYLIF